MTEVKKLHKESKAKEYRHIRHLFTTTDCNNIDNVYVCDQESGAVEILASRPCRRQGLLPLKQLDRPDLSCADSCTQQLEVKDYRILV